MKNKKLLAIILLSLSFCFVSGAGYGEEELQRQPGINELFRQPSFERFSFLVIPTEGAVIMFWTFLDMYPDAEIPEEFALILPSEINNIDKIKESRGVRRLGSDFGIWSDFIVSLLLTMAYQQDYEIEDVTSSYVVLKKFVDEEELKEWEEKLNE